MRYSATEDHVALCADVGCPGYRHQKLISELFQKEANPGVAALTADLLSYLLYFISLEVNEPRQQC